MILSPLKPPLSFPTLTGSIVTFNSQYALPLKSHKIALTATQSGSGTPSPDNVRTINGYSALNITATGRNIFPTISTFPYTASGNVYFYDFAANGTARKIPIIHLKEGVEYTLSFDVTIDNEPFYITVGAGNGAFSRDIQWSDALSSGRVSVTFTPTASDLQSGDILAFRCPRYSTAQTFTFTIDNVQLEYGGLTDYQPFGTYTTITIGSTVYGGEYDAITGILTVTHKIVDLGTLNWNRYTTQSTNKTYFRTSAEISDCIKSTSVNLTYGMTCSNYVEGAWTNVLDASGYDLNFALGWSGRSYIAIYDSSKSEMTAADFKTAMNGVQLMYPLATQQTIQLPPCPIDTLEGVQNIWADTGDTTLQYPKFG